MVGDYKRSTSRFHNVMKCCDTKRSVIKRNRMKRWNSHVKRGASRRINQPRKKENSRAVPFAKRPDVSQFRRENEDGKMNQNYNEN